MSATSDLSELLRPGLLEGVSMLLAGASGGAGAACGGLGAAVSAACMGLGARVAECPLDCDGSLDLDEARIEQAVDRVLADAGSVELLVIDGASLFGRAEDEGPAGGQPGGGRAALQACLDASWNVTRALANRAFMPDERGGRIVYLAPPPDAGEHGDAARAGLENLARTLSIEWARHGITAVAIAPGAGPATGARTAAAARTGTVAMASEVAALTAYLASPAGAYFSGCLLDLRGPEVAGLLDT
jgi:NAD(P)-dependent dehydrogenase (short-subunit alcohol dehydrogenase family)